MSRAYRVHERKEPEPPAGLNRPVIILLTSVASIAAVASALVMVWLIVRQPGQTAPPPSQPRSAALIRAPTTSSTPGPRTPVLKLRDHPLVNNARLVLHPAPCSLPAWKDHAADEQVFFRSAVACLNTTWRQVFVDGGLPFEDADLVVHYGKSYDTPCGGNRDSSSLCDKTLHILYPEQASVALSPNPGASLGFIAGWYGEYVQSQAGITEAYRETLVNLPKNSPERGEFARRHNLQWQCFSGYFIYAEAGAGDVTAQMEGQALAGTANYGDDNGATSVNASPESHRRWFQRGVAATSLVDCNTWAAPPDEVR